MAQNAKTAKPYERPSLTAVQSMKKDEVQTQLKLALAHMNTLESTDRDATLINRIDDKIKENLRTFKEEIKAELQTYCKGIIQQQHLEVEQRLQKLEKENEDMRKCAAFHQQFIESLDHRNREKDLIITGVPETGVLRDNGTEAESDEMKCQLIFGKVFQAVPLECVRRLGAPDRPDGWNRPDGSAPRPLKVTLRCEADRRGILANSKKLKDAHHRDNPFNKIFVKKDTHPLIRKEWSRLYEVQRNERDKPGNIGRTVIVNRKDRTVTIDNEVIDRFQYFCL